MGRQALVAGCAWDWDLSSPCGSIGLIPALYTLLPAWDSLLPLPSHVTGISTIIPSTDLEGPQKSSSPPHFAAGEREGKGLLLSYMASQGKAGTRA